MRKSSDNPASEIVFFDGVCNLCNGFVDFLIQRKPPFKLSSLQGETAARLLPKNLTTELPSVVFFSDGKILLQSAAALMAISRLGGKWTFISRVALFIPTPLRDLVYNWIARNRYAWFGRRETCRLPLDEEKAYFLN